MANAKEIQRSRLKGIGITMSASPPFQELRDEMAGLFAAGRSEDEVRRAIAERLVDDELFGIRAFLGINRYVARLPVAEGIVRLARHWAEKLKKQTFRDLLVEWTHRNNLDLWVADYIVEWAQSDEPPALTDRAGRVVGDFTIGEQGGPVVFLMASALCDPEEAAQEFKTRCAKAFPPETWVRKGYPERDAQRFKDFAEGATDFDIAKSELEAEGWHYVAANKREFNREVATRANSVLQSRKRWDSYLTGLLETVSPRNAD